jgi:hypothetical protein
LFESSLLVQNGTRRISLAGLSGWGWPVSVDEVDGEAECILNYRVLFCSPKWQHFTEEVPGRMWMVGPERPASLRAVTAQSCLGSVTVPRCHTSHPNAQLRPTTTKIGKNSKNTKSNPR